MNPLAKLQNRVTSLLYAMADDPWPYALRLALLAIVALATLFALAGCAAAPAGAPLAKCPQPEAYAFESGGKVCAIFDYENLKKLHDRMVGLRAGTCLE